MLRNGISLITLKEHVEFGNKDNDPVDIVFSLCAKSHKSHLNVLENLSRGISRRRKSTVVKGFQQCESSI